MHSVKKGLSPRQDKQRCAASAALWNLSVLKFQGEMRRLGLDAQLPEVTRLCTELVNRLQAMYDDDTLDLSARTRGLGIRWHTGDVRVDWASMRMGTLRSELERVLVNATPITAAVQSAAALAVSDAGEADARSEASAATELTQVAEEHHSAFAQVTQSAP
eukprot:1594291-Pyramimonas_sp.AAC.1